MKPFYENKTFTGIRALKVISHERIPSKEEEFFVVKNL